MRGFLAEHHYRGPNTSPGARVTPRPARLSVRAQGEKLAADAELFDDRAVAIDVGLRQVIEKATTLTYEQQQTAAAVVIMLVSLEVAS